LCHKGAIFHKLQIYIKIEKFRIIDIILSEDMIDQQLYNKSLKYLKKLKFKKIVNNNMQMCISKYIGICYYQLG